MSVDESIHDVSTLINQFMATEDDDEMVVRFSSELAELLSKDQIRLLNFIQALGSTLTSDNMIIRMKGVHCLSSTLERLSASKLSKQDVNVLVDFLLAKLDDNNSTTYILQALISLVQYKAFNPGLNNNIDKILENVIEKYDRKKHLAKVRYEAFKLLLTLLQSYNAYIVNNHETSDKFVEVFIHVASGEKDPRNLLESFELNTRINETFEFDSGNEKHKEYLAELFDVCFCYFPISFTPPANDPYKIKAEDLKDKLTRTIASQSLYAKDSFSSLIEKLTSTNPVIRNDVLKTIHVCVQSYTSDCLLEFWDSIWNALKYEILHNDVSLFNSNSDVFYPTNFESTIEDYNEDKTLYFTGAILQELSVRLSQEQEYENILKRITSELKKSLSTITDKLFKQTVLIACLMSSKSKFAFNFIIDFIFSYDVWGKYFNVEADLSESTNQEIDVNEEITLNVAKQRDLVDSVGYLFIAYQTLSTVLGDEKFSEKNSLLPFKDHILLFLGQLLQTSSRLEKTLKCNVIQKLVKVIRLQGFLSAQESTLIFNYFKDLIEDTISFEKQWENDLVIKEIVNGLVAVMDESDEEGVINVKRENISLVTEYILPTFMNLIAVEESKVPDLDDLAKLLNVFDNLCVNYQFLEVLSIRLLNKISYLNGSDSIPSEKKVIVFTNIVDLLLNGIYKTEFSKQFLMNSWHKNFLPRFFECFLVLFKQIQDEDMVELCGCLFGVIVKFTDKSKHQELLDNYTDGFIENTPFLGKSTVASTLEDPSLLVFIYNRILANIDKSAKFKEDFVITLIHKLLQILNSIDPPMEYLRLGYLQCLALVMNKFVVGEEQLVIAYSIIEKLQSDSNPGVEKPMTIEHIKTFEILIWIIKGLVMKSDRKGMELADSLTDLVKIESGQVRDIVFKSLNVLFIDVPLFINSTPKIKKLISKVNCLNVRLLYKQNLFERILPKLISQYLATKDEIYLICTSLVISNLTTQIIKPHLSEIFPLILNSLSLKDTKILKASLTTLNIVISEDQALVTPHLHSIVTRLQDLVTKPVIRNGKIVNDEEIRILSLNCMLNLFSKVEAREIIKYRLQSISVLKKALDDKKRSVRKWCSDVIHILHETGR